MSQAMAPGVWSISAVGEHSISVDLYVLSLCWAPCHRGGTDWGSFDLIIPWAQSGATYITLEG